MLQSLQKSQLDTLGIFFNNLKLTAEVGALHGKRCSVQGWERIPAEFGRYDYLNGVLGACRMCADFNHQQMASAFQLLFYEIRRRMEENDPRRRCIIALAVKVVIKTRHYRIPDVVIGIPELSNQSPYSKTNPPRMVIEITNSNRETDFWEKKTNYLAIQVAHYLIVDREYQKFVLHTLYYGTYVESSFEGDEEFSHDLLETVTVRDFFTADSPSKVIGGI